MPAVVHGGHEGRGAAAAAAEIAHADGRVGAIGHGEGSGVSGLEAARGRSRGELGVPENGRRGGELAGDAQGRGRARGGGRGG